MGDALETFERDGWTASVFYDEDAESPASWTNVGALAYRTRGASAGDAEYLPHPDFDLDESFARQAYGEVRMALPVRAWDDRNGTELRIADSWDEASGWMVATPDSVRETLGDDASDEQVRAALESEMEAWQQWAQGDVYGVVVTDPSGRVDESMWGFYDFDNACDEARSMLDASIEHAAREAARVDRMMRL